ncbi:MAG: hypothetical protein FD129_988 [bacterium]|nr:MAG: hypothetical protein FD129_988 [bacterium]
MFLLPLIAGMVVRRLAPTFAERAGDPIMAMAGLVLIGVALLLLATNFKAILGIGLSGLLLIVLMTSVALAIGHLLGGPDPDNRTVLAVTGATRFPGLAVLVAQLNFPNARPLPIVVAYLLISSLAVLPYIKWRQSRQPDPTA